MLSRRHLRTKVLQAFYAFIQSGNSDIADGEKHLLKSVDKLYELYISQLFFLVEIADFACKRAEEAKNKFLPTENDLNPNTRFIDNSVIRQIEENRNFKKYINNYKTSWADEQELIRIIYKEIIKEDFFDKYMVSKNHSYMDDQEVLIKIVKKTISGFELLEQYYEDKSIYWSFDDFHTANIMVIKTIKQFIENQSHSQPLPPIFKADVETDNEDRQFMIELFRKSVLHHEDYKKMIAEKACNWELDRIAVMDILLINMALTEIVGFPSIPIKVTLNEYIEISKYFSSAKSKVFINGILDKMVEELKLANKIKKSGRGLMES
jgi:N utilization substance protein B